MQRYGLAVDADLIDERRADRAAPVGDPNCAEVDDRRALRLGVVTVRRS